MRDDVITGDPRRPSIRPQQRRQHTHRRRLPGPVRSEQAEDRPLLHTEVKPSKSVGASEGLLNRYCLNG